MQGSEINGAEVFTEYNHNNRDNPHDQYDHFKIFNTDSNKSHESRYVKIFDCNFQKDPNLIDSKLRFGNKLIYKFNIYNMNNSFQFQGVTSVCLYVFVDGSGILQTDVKVDYNFTNDTSQSFILLTKNLQNPITAEFNIKLFASAGSWGRVNIQPVLYDTVSNYTTPHNIQSSKYGTNIMTKLNSLYKDLNKEQFYTFTELETLYPDYYKSGKNINNYNFRMKELKNREVSLDLTNIEIINMAQPAGSPAFKTTTGNYVGKRLSIYSFSDFNNYIDRESVDTMFTTQEKTNLKIPIGGMISFIFYQNKWHETGRNFAYSLNNDEFRMKELTNGQNSIDLTNIDVINMAQPAGSPAFKTTTGNYVGKRLSIYSFNDTTNYIDRESVDTMFITKETTNLKIPINGMISFIFYQNKWQEAGRNF